MKKKLLWISLAYICFILTACNNNAENPSSQTKNNVTTDSLEIIETVINNIGHDSVVQQHLLLQSVLARVWAHPAVGRSGYQPHGAPSA